MSNVQRRSSKQRQSIAKAARSLEQYEDRSVECNIVEALTNLRHFADFYGLKMHELLDASYVHYCDEVSDARVTTDTE